MLLTQSLRDAQKAKRLAEVALKNFARGNKRVVEYMIYHNTK